MEQQRPTITLAKRMVAHNCVLQEYLSDRTKEFPLKVALELVDFTREGVLADARRYPQLQAIYSISRDSEIYEEKIEKVLLADDAAALLELVSAIYAEFDADLERTEFWVASCYLLRAQYKKNPELCESIRETFRSVKSTLTYAAFVNWLSDIVSELLRVPLGGYVIGE